MRYLLLVVAALALTACASRPDIYDKYGATQAQFQRDIGYCQMAGMNAPQYHPVQLPPNYVANTTYGYGSSTTTIQPQENPLNGLNSLAAAIGNRNRQVAIVRYCMEAKGYTLRAAQ